MKAKELYDLIAAKTEFFSANSGQCFEFVYPKHVKEIAEQYATLKNQELENELKTEKENSKSWCDVAARLAKDALSVEQKNQEQSKQIETLTKRVDILKRDLIETLTEDIAPFTEKEAKEYVEELLNNKEG